MESKIEIYQALWHSFFGLRLTIGQALNVGTTRGLTFEDAILLTQVAQNRGISVRDIARISGRDVASLSRQSTRLEARGWLVKTRSEKDARLCTMNVTKRAVGVLPLINETIERVIGECVEGLSVEERQELVRMLFIVNNKISTLREAAATPNKQEVKS